jgi:hypothetical protein
MGVFELSCCFGGNYIMYQEISMKKYVVLVVGISIVCELPVSSSFYRQVVVKSNNGLCLGVAGCCFFAPYLSRVWGTLLHRK